MEVVLGSKNSIMEVGLLDIGLDISASGIQLIGAWP